MGLPLPTPLASGSVVRPGPEHAPATAPGQLAVVPVEEEQGEGAHDQEEQHPHSEARVVFDGLEDGSTGVFTLHGPR